jgi:hypothetical protein
MTTRAAQVPMLEHVAPSMLSNGRRSLPPAVIRPGQRPMSQQWRERPRCPGPRVAPGADDGVVHAIAGRVRCHSPRSQFVRDKRAAQVAVSVAASFRTSTVRARAPDCPRTGPVQTEPTRHVQGRAGTSSAHPHHRVADGRAVLRVVNALRSASTRPKAGPAGIDDACARRVTGTCAMAGMSGFGPRSKTRLTREFLGRIVTISRLCRTAHPPFRTTCIRSAFSAVASRARFPRTSHDHRVSHTPHALRCRVRT